MTQEGAIATPSLVTPVSRQNRPSIDRWVISNMYRQSVHRVQFHVSTRRSRLFPPMLIIKSQQANHNSLLAFDHVLRCGLILIDCSMQVIPPGESARDSRDAVYG